MFFLFFNVYLQPARYSSIYIGKKSTDVILQFQSLPWQLLGISFAENGCW